MMYNANKQTRHSPENPNRFFRMEEAGASTGMAMASLGSRGLEELAIEGQKQLEVSVQSAHEILGSLNEVLSNPALWAGGDSGAAGKEEAGWAAVDEARQRYRSATSVLRAIVAAIFNHPQMRSLDGESAATEKKVDQAEIDKLQKHTVELRQEITRKNDVLKQLITQMRELVRDISMWQNSKT